MIGMRSVERTVTVTAASVRAAISEQPDCDDTRDDG
jgi:hypothetical protein